MTATDQKLIELLQEKISQISKLMESYDRYALEQWKTEVSMILELSLIHISEPTRQEEISYPVFFFEE